jgi:hypothetical protein
MEPDSILEEEQNGGLLDDKLSVGVFILDVRAEVVCLMNKFTHYIFE